MFPWLNTYAPAIQALSAVSMVLLTVVLLLITIASLAFARETLVLLRQDAIAKLRPNLVPAIRYGKNDVFVVSWSVANAGPNDAVLRRIAFDGYCSHSENSQLEKREFPFFHDRLIPAGESITHGLNFDPNKNVAYHDAHEGSCYWIFRLTLECQDYLGLGTYEYCYDDVGGIRHVINEAHRPAFVTTWLRWWRRKVEEMQEHDRSEQ